MDSKIEERNKEKTPGMPSSEFAEGMGILYSIGWGVERNYAKAEKWLRQVKNPDADCSFLLYRAATMRDDPDPDRDALEDLEKAADGGNARAAYLLGQIYGDEKWKLLLDYPRALGYYRKVAEKSADAAYQIGRFYQNGFGVEKNEDEALSWYQKAAQKGYAPAICLLCDPKDADREFRAQIARYQAALKKHKKHGGNKEEQDLFVGGIFREGETLTRTALWADCAAKDGDGEMGALCGILSSVKGSRKKDLADAVAYYQKAVEVGNTDAMLGLASLYQTGRGVKKDPAKAIELLKQAADAGSGLAMFRLGEIFETGKGTKKDPAAALDWYQKAADRNNAEAMVRLGKLYQTGVHVKKDDEEAVRRYLQAAKKESYEALLELGRIYQKGLGGKEKNLALAAGYLREAVERTIETMDFYLKACGEKRG